MHPIVQGEFSHYPESIRELFPRVQHSIFELRQMKVAVLAFRISTAV